MPSNTNQQEERMPLKNKIIKYKDFVLKLFNKISDDNAFDLAASLAYYTVFSLAPFIFILINVLGLLFEEERVRTTIFNSLAELIGTNGAIQLQNTLINLGVNEADWYKNIIGIIILIFTATTIFATIQNGLNFIFRVKLKSSVGIFNFFKTRLLAFALIIGIAFIALISLALNGLAVLFSDIIIQTAPALETIIKAFNNFFIPFLISAILFLIIFKYLPDASAGWKDLLIGAIFTSILFAIGRYVIGFYIGQSNIATVYDAAGSIMVIFVWTYYSSLIFYIGAIFTVLYAEEFGSSIQLKKNTNRFIQKEYKIE